MSYYNIFKSIKIISNIKCNGDVITNFKPYYISVKLNYFRLKINMVIIHKQALKYQFK